MLKSKKIGFIGGGNMAEALIKGLLSASFIEAKSLMVSDVSTERLEWLRKEYHVRTTDDNVDLAKKCDIILLAVKPQAIREVLEGIADSVDDTKLVISIAAGIPIKTITGCLSPDGSKELGVVRTMPNTPALVHEGVTALAANHQVSAADLKVAHRIFEAVGKTVDVSESNLDAVTGLSGSGPAYIFMIIEALSDAGVKMGLSRDVANILTLQTVLGSAKLALESGKHPGELKDQVTSPGGTTISGLHALEKGGLRTTLMNAVEEATKRSQVLGQNSANNHPLKKNK
ncbi:MAG: pyrroline-5-carboxylate reductase [Nitrospinota bacterium]|nr:pyrroline-5-carboxylate reductase [Nitrospinota bacterium]